MTFCSECGEKLRPGVRFCPNCGAPIHTPPQPPQPRYLPPTPPPPPPPPAARERPSMAEWRREREGGLGRFCPSCGNPLKLGDRFCRSCGASLIEEVAPLPPPPTLPPAPPPAWHPPPRAKLERPLGVAILAVLDMIGGVLFSITGGIAILFAPGLVGFEGVPLEEIFPIWFAFLGVLGGILVITGIIAFLVGWGFWKGKGWARTLSIVLYLIAIILGVLPALLGNYASVVVIIIPALILYYLYRPNVKAWFGKA